MLHRTTCRVIYGDTDNMGMAYHANYFRWFEQGRTEMFRDLGLPYSRIEAKGVFMPVSEAWCKFRAPIRYDDLLIIETELDGRIRGGMKFNYRLFRDQEETLLAEGFTRHACVDPDGKVIRPPAFIREFIAAHVGD
ncbi:MAG: acyl-CoA thioesterase [Desulfobacterales bacterium]|nr:acyl-CoA thioesterase [Desulfobacterales bacterium]